MIEQEHGKITPEILEKVRQTLEAEVKEYDYYLTNQCYGFQLFKEDVEVDSCWGIPGGNPGCSGCCKGASAGGLQSGNR